MSNRKKKLILAGKSLGVKVVQTAVCGFNDNKALDVIQPIHQLNALFGSHHHDGGRQAVCQGAVVRNNRNADNAVGDRVPVELYNWMGGMVPTVQEIVDRVECEL